MTEMQSQLEDDIDTEIEHLRKAFNDKLTASRETTMKYKGQLGEEVHHQLYCFQIMQYCVLTAPNLAV